MRFNKLLHIFVIFAILFTAVGCKNSSDNFSSNYLQTSTAISNQETSNVATSSAAISSEEVNSEIATSVENDGQSPQNTETFTESGVEITAENLTPKKGLAFGVDVSKWQGKIDWKQVKSSGIDFAIIRIGFRGENGNIYKDDFADYNIQQAQNAGILVGVYFYSNARTTAEAVEEAAFTLSAIEGYSISYPVVYDCEDFMHSGSRMYGITAKQRTDNAIAFFNEISKNGYEAMLYSPKTELEKEYCWDTSRIESVAKIWIARYPNTVYTSDSHPDYSGKYDMWQYTDNGKVSGITGGTDISVSYFTKEKAAPKNESVTPNTAVAPETDSIYSAASDEVTAKDEVNLRTSDSTKSDVVAVLQNGTFIKRIAIGTNGWSKLSYNGKTVYAITSYLTTDKEYVKPQESDGFTAASGSVTAKEETNLRAEPSTTAEIVFTIKNGEFAELVGTNPNGWSKLSYGGKTVYAKTSLLTDKVNTSTESTTSVVNDGFTDVYEQVTAKEETNLRTQPNTNSEIVITLKNGEYVTRIGINTASGWSKLSYNGQPVYTVTSYLTVAE